MKAELKLNRRQLLVWSTPVVTSIALPAHAQCSVCFDPPILTVLAPPKCSGDPVVGTAVIEILAPDGCVYDIKAITVETDDAKSDLSSLPDLPAEISDVDGQTVTWIGPASDATSCLPLAAISMTLEYCCVGDDTIFEETYDLLQLLVDSIP